ncbi:hypothetical protein AB751O23_AE_00210 [Chlamydiales bacterium SCGC AB-751-O23]|nr:hypothetical protein AB751O23_AE_00210 [Chlamydiales bacterium SCGC AB-751-O23]
MLTQVQNTLATSLAQLNKYLPQRTETRVAAALVVLGVAAVAFGKIQSLFKSSEKKLDPTFLANIAKLKATDLPILLRERIATRDASAVGVVNSLIDSSPISRFDAQGASFELNEHFEATLKEMKILGQDFETKEQAQIALKTAVLEIISHENNNHLNILRASLEGPKHKQHSVMLTEKEREKQTEEIADLLSTFLDFKATGVDEKVTLVLDEATDKSHTETAQNLSDRASLPQTVELEELEKASDCVLESLKGTFSHQLKLLLRNKAIPTEEAKLLKLFLKLGAFITAEQAQADSQTFSPSETHVLNGSKGSDVFVTDETGTLTLVSKEMADKMKEDNSEGKFDFQTKKDSLEALERNNDELEKALEALKELKFTSQDNSHQVLNLTRSIKNQREKGNELSAELKNTVEPSPEDETAVVTAITAKKLELEAQIETSTRKIKVLEQQLATAVTAQEGFLKQGAELTAAITLLREEIDHSPVVKLFTSDAHQDKITGITRSIAIQDAKAHIREAKNGIAEVTVERFREDLEDKEGSKNRLLTVMEIRELEKAHMDAHMGTQMLPLEED